MLHGFSKTFFILAVASLTFFSGLKVYALNTCSTGYQNSGVTNINCHGNCRQVSNSSTSQFIPTKTSSEWNNFISNHNGSITFQSPTNGGFTGWGACSVSCGGGTQTRTCTNPSPSFCGSNCSGATSQSCNTQSCSDTPFWSSCIGDCSGASTFSCSTGKFMYSMTVKTGQWGDKVVQMKCASSNNSTGNDDLINGTEETISINVGGASGSSHTADCSPSDIFAPAFQAHVNGSGYLSDFQFWCDNINDSAPTDNSRPSDCGSAGACGVDTGSSTLVECTTGLGITKVKVKTGSGYVTGMQIRCGSATTP